MKLKKIIIVILLLLVLLFGVGLVITYINYSKAKKIDSGVKFKNYFPFGKGSLFTPPTDTKPGEDGNGEDNTVVDTEPNGKLIKVSDEPIAGFAFIQKEYFPDSTTPTETIDTKTVTVTPKGTWTEELKYGSKGEAVQRLQQTLNACPELGLSQTGPGSPGKETTLFVERTFEAVKKFQVKFKDDILTPQKLTEPTGILDELTRKKISSPFVCKTVATGTPSVKPGGILKTVIRYIEKGTGNVYDFEPLKKETSRLTNQTIPRIAEASFGNNGNNVFVRYLKDDNQTIETYFAKVPKQVLGGDGTEGELTGKFLQKNIIDITLDKKGETAFMQTIAGTSAQGALFTLSDENKKQFFSSPFFEWLSQWTDKNIITMTTKASGFVQGHMFALNVKNGDMKKIFGDVFGLTTNTNPDFTKVLFSKSTDRSVLFGLHDITSEKNYNLNVNTLPDKCTWSSTGGTIYCGVPRILPGGVYPDEWYQGVISTSDQIVRIDPTQLYDNEVLVDPEDEGVTIDVGQIQADKGELYTAFVDKKTNILYMVHN